MMLVAAVAPAAASAPQLACNKWQRNLTVKGDFLKEIEQPDYIWCRKQCMMHEGCEASTFLPTGHRKGKVKLHLASTSLNVPSIEASASSPVVLSTSATIFST